MNSVLLADKGIAYMPIAITSDACETIVTASKELAHYLCRITGAVFSIQAEAEGAAIRLSVDETLAEEEYVIAICADCGVSITGGTPRGVLYGVYAL